MRWIGLLAVVASFGLGIFTIAPSLFAPTLRVPDDYPTIQAAIDAAPAGAVIRLAPGRYAGPLEIAKAISIVGAPDHRTQIASEAGTVIAIRDTRGVRVEGISIIGGDHGIMVDESVAVQLVNNRVLGATVAGIRLSRAAALIKGNEVRAGSGPYGMGIELANTMSRPPSLVTGNLVVGATQEGIVLHNSHASIENNTVMGNGLRGVSISEMSMASVTKNRIMDNADAGIWVVDSSMADIEGNHISDVRPGPTGRANGIGVFYHAEVRLGRYNDIAVDPERAIVATFEGTVESR